jgi:hypothetical protein
MKCLVTEKLMVDLPIVTMGIRANGCSKLSVISAKSAVDRLNPSAAACGFSAACAKAPLDGSEMRTTAMAATYQCRERWARRILSS